jgi:predicted nucleic acid-binding protein
MISHFKKMLDITKKRHSIAKGRYEEISNEYEALREKTNLIGGKDNTNIEKNSKKTEEEMSDGSNQSYLNLMDSDTDEDVEEVNEARNDSRVRNESQMDLRFDSNASEVVYPEEDNDRNVLLDE